MNLELLWPLVITSIIAILGWFTAHLLSSNRERAAKRREMRVHYLLDAWRRLENASNRYKNSRSADLESAIADIQLLGSDRQISLAHKFVENFVENKHALLDELLNDLRFDLRKELRLPTASKKIKHLRIITDSENNPNKN